MTSIIHRMPLEDVLVDVRQGWRTLRRAPAFSLVVVATIALAVGANTALFSVFNALVLTPLPVRDPSRLVVLTATSATTTGTQMIYDATLQQLRESQHLFTAMTLYSGGGALRVAARGVETDGGIEGMDPGYFEMVGARAQAGRLLQPSDAIGPRGVPVIVISDRLWQQLFARDPLAIGATILVNTTPLTVVGVVAPPFRGLQTDVGADLFVTMPAIRALAGDVTRPVRGRNVIAQLAPGVTVEQARAEVQARWPTIRGADVPGLPAADQRTLATQQILVDSIATGFSPLREQYSKSLSVLVVLTGLLLAIGCANLSGMLLARAVTRDRQIAIRLALGATRRRVVQQLLVETIMLAALGTIAAVPLAWWTSGAIGGLLTADSFLPPAIATTPDLRVLALAAFIALATGGLIGLLPAWHSMRTRAAVVVEGTRATAARSLMSRALLVAQIALSLVLLVTALLFTRSLNRLRASEAQYRPSEIVWSRLWVKVTERRSAKPYSDPYWTDLTQQFESLPGVTSAAYAVNFPVLFNAAFGVERFAIVDEPDRTEEAQALFEGVSPGFFRTIGVPLLQGRDIAWTDTPTTTPVALVTAAFAQRAFPGGSALGRRIRVVSRAPQTYEVVGVVADAAFKTLGNPHQPAVFRALPQEAATTVPQPIMLVRVRGAAAVVADAFQHHLPAQAPHFVRSVRRFDEYIDQVLLRERLVTWLSSFFAILAVLLSCLGLYGLLAYSVARRTREIGVRMALGATPRAMLQTIGREGVLLGVVGVVAGVPCTLLTGRFVRVMLDGLEPNDAATIAVAAIALCGLAGIAGLIPAYRASTVDPMAALRRD